MLVIVFSLFCVSRSLARSVCRRSNEQAARPPASRRTWSSSLSTRSPARWLPSGPASRRRLAGNVGDQRRHRHGLDVIAAVVIGGVSLAGGSGTIIGSIIGAAIMAVLRNAFVLLSSPSTCRRFQSVS